MAVLLNPTAPQSPSLCPEVHCPISPPVNMPLPLNQNDVVTPALVKPFIPETIDRPILPPPDFSSRKPQKPPTLSELQFLAAMATFRSFADDLLVNLGVRLEGFRLNLQDISADNVKKLKESAEHAKSADFWCLLKKAATSLLSALSVVIGISLVATGAATLVGAAMIGSGICSLANLLMSESGVWDWVAKKLAHEDMERQQMLAMLLPCAVGLLAAVVGGFGSAGAFAWTGVQFMDKAILIAQTALAMFDGSVTIGKGYSDAKTNWLNADLTEVKSEITIEREMVSKTTTSIENVLDHLKMSYEKSSQFMQMAIRSNQAAVEMLS